MVVSSKCLALALCFISFVQHSTPAVACAFVSSARCSNSWKKQAPLAANSVNTDVCGDMNEPAPAPVLVQTTMGDDLTKQALNERFWETRDYYRQNPQENMCQADVCLKLLSTRLPNVRLNRCFVGPSTVKGAGNGLFASRDIANDELITMYPGDAVLIVEKPKPASASSASREDDTSSPPSPLAPVVGVMFGSHIQGEFRDPNRVSTLEAKRYEMTINQQTSIVADPNLGFDDAAYLGHFANDGAALVAFDAASRQEYSKASMECHNSAHFVMEGAHMVTVATKPIAKGEEIFVSYEEGYWLSRSLARMSDSDMDASEKSAILGDFTAAAAAKPSSALNGNNNDKNINNSEAKRPTNASKRRKTKKKGASSQDSEKKGFGK